MAVDCEVLLPSGKPCGIQAIRRCSVDDVAFCASHQGGEFNLCLPCFSRGAHEAIGSGGPSSTDPARYIAEQARGDLSAAGVTKVEVYAADLEEQRIIGAGTGWVLGGFEWILDLDGHELHRQHTTVLVDADFTGPPRGAFPLFYGGPTERGFYVPYVGRITPATRERIADTILRLAGNAR